MNKYIKGTLDNTFFQKKSMKKCNLSIESAPKETSMARTGRFPLYIPLQIKLTQN
jgi:hypothetical protein